jgi:uncharacterized repeat protein (TIGR03806 family)
MKLSVFARGYARGALGAALALAMAACSNGGSSKQPKVQGAAGSSAAGSGSAGASGASGGGPGAAGSAGSGTAGSPGTAGSAGGAAGMATAGSGPGGSVVTPCTDCVDFGLQTRPANPTCVAGAPPPTAYKFDRIWANVQLTTALDIVPSPNGKEMIVAQKNGVALAVPLDPNATQAQVRTFLDLRAEINTDAESGLLSFAFHPDYKNNGFAYVVYTRNDGMHSTRVARFKTNDNGMTLDLTTEQKVYEHTQIRGTHHGGDMRFGPDGYLYVSFGDNNTGDNHTDFTAADPKILYGKLVRLDINVPGAGYKIPADNPFAANPTMGAPEMFARGLRNPWRFSFDRQTKEIWLADPGEETNGIKGADGMANPFERIDRITKGGFYGWPYWQGTHCYHDCTREMGLPPEAEYSHNGGPSAIIGGYVYRGSALPGLVGKYIHGDYEVGQTFIYDPMTKMRTSMGVGGKPVAFGEDNDGELYVSREGGTIEKLQNGVVMGPGGFPMLLSQTGCVLATDPTKPVPGMIPFSVALPFWSDGAEKERFLAVPDGQTISVAADGDFTLPPGGVTMKNFRWMGKLFETRFFVRHSDGSYYGYSYEWNAAGTDATKVAETGKDAMLAGNMAWWYPSTSGCFTCHNEAAGRSLGLETRQLNSVGTYGTVKANQFDTLKHIGLLSGNMTALAAFPAKDDATQPVDVRARAYLAVNCSNCHRPNGPGRGNWNALFDTAFKDMGVCNMTPDYGDLGVTGAALLKPSAHGSSLMWLRMSQRTMDFMPPLATKIPDQVGADLLSNWIDHIAACP